MNVLILAPEENAKLLCPAIELGGYGSGDEAFCSMSTPWRWPKDADYIVSFGYRHIIKEPHLSFYSGRMINIHISVLPWNRGADPNFWSWFDVTPKGVTIHAIDGGIDTGHILVGSQIKEFPNDTTLRSSYNHLILAAGALFRASWGNIRDGKTSPKPQEESGSYHKKSDLEPWWPKLSAGWDTPVREVEELGRKHREMLKQGERS